MIGRVIFSSGTEYKVLYENQIFICRPLGIFNKENKKIFVGDLVEFEINEDQKGKTELNVIKSILKRKNIFVRPSVVNVDNAFLFLSVKNPEPNLYNLDKLITIFQSYSVKPIIFFTKSDLEISIEIEKQIDLYKISGFQVFIFSRELNKKDYELFLKIIENKINVITGISGVGKSTFLNNLIPNLNLKIGQLSIFKNKGKHTTTSIEAFPFLQNSIIIDTPGFTSLNLNSITLEQISWNFLNFEKYASDCKMKGCLHLNEKGCKILELLKQGIINKDKYNIYLQIIKEKQFTVFRK